VREHLPAAGQQAAHLQFEGAGGRPCFLRRSEILARAAIAGSGMMSESVLKFPFL
jgi:hypothetical protein